MMHLLVSSIQTERKYYVSLPTNEVHQQHLTGTVAGMCRTIVSEKIEEHVNEGYSDAREVQRYLLSRSVVIIYQIRQTVLTFLLLKTLGTTCIKLGLDCNSPSKSSRNN